MSNPHEPNQVMPQYVAIYNQSGRLLAIGESEAQAVFHAKHLRELRGESADPKTQNTPCPATEDQFQA